MIFMEQKSKPETMSSKIVWGELRKKFFVFPDFLKKKDLSYGQNKLCMSENPGQLYFHTSPELTDNPGKS